MSGFDLRYYLKLFPSICQRKFGQEYDFSIVEKRLAPLRDGVRRLTAMDVLEIFDQKLTPFGRYWIVPNKEEFEQSLQQKELFLGPSLPDPHKLLDRLLAIVSNLFVASLIARFVYPDHYGVSSTPVVNLLQVQRSSTVESYIAFIEELKVWKDHFGLPSVAQTEMALWAYDQVAKGRYGSPDESHQAFEGDIWCQRRRAAQAIRPFLRKYGNLQLARILAGEDPKLAGKIAGEEYERLLDCASKKCFGHSLKNAKGEVKKLIENLLRYNHISLKDKLEMDDIWKIRCNAVHPRGQPEEHEIESMIDKIERICEPWKIAGICTSSAKKRH